MPQDAGHTSKRCTCVSEFASAFWGSTHVSGYYYYSANLSFWLPCSECFQNGEHKSLRGQREAEADEKKGNKKTIGEANYLKGLCLLEQLEFQQALESFSGAIKADKKHAEVLFFWRLYIEKYREHSNKVFPVYNIITTSKFA